MAEILEMRRVFETVKKQVIEYRWMKNPLYDINDAIGSSKQGMYYPHEEYIEKEIPKTENRRRSHIEYRIECSYCGGTKEWVRRKDAKFCSNGCRNLARITKLKKEN